MLEIIGLREICEITNKEIDLILIGVKPDKARIQARRWFEMKQRRKYAEKGERHRNE